MHLERQFTFLYRGCICRTVTLTLMVFAINPTGLASKSKVSNTSRYDNAMIGLSRHPFKTLVKGWCCRCKNDWSKFGGLIWNDKPPQISTLTTRREIDYRLQHQQPQTMATSLDSHFDSILSTSASIESLSFSDMPTHFIASHHQSGVDNLIRDPLPHERGLFTVQQKENVAPNGEGDPKVIRARQGKPGVSPLLMAKYSAGGNVEADVFLRSADTLLDV